MLPVDEQSISGLIISTHRTVDAASKDESIRIFGWLEKDRPITM